VLAAVKYFGFQPKGTTTTASGRTVETQYLWHELTPTLTAGYSVGALVPFVGVQKPFLFGRKDVSVAFNGQAVPSASGRSNYNDAEQDIRGIVGVEWRWPDGYSLTGEAAVAPEGAWTLSLGVSQILK
jgi:hypothetical protein